MLMFSKPAVAITSVLIIVLWLGAGRGLAATAPTNDNFGDAFEIVTGSGGGEVAEFAGTTVGATVEPGENENVDLAASNQRGTVWWKWTCPAAGQFYFQVYSTSGSLMAGAFTGTSVSNLVTISAPFSDPFVSPDPAFEGGEAVFGATAGTTYWLAVMLKPDTGHPAGDIQGLWAYAPDTPPPPPLLNDNFADRIALSGTNLTVQANNSAATTEAGENIGGGLAILEATVWYSWTAPTGGVVYISGSTTALNFILSIGTFRGSAVNALVPAASTPDGGISVQPGDTIVIQVGTIYYTLYGGGGGKGPFALNVRLEVPTPTSPNDNYANRLDITAPVYHFEGSMFGATNELSEPLPETNFRQTLWWRFVPPEEGLFQLSVAANFNSRLAVYDGGSFGTMLRLTEVNTALFMVHPGHEYSVQLASDYAASGAFTLDARFFSRTNDMFAGSTHLEGSNFVYYGNFTFASAEIGEPVSEATNTVWISWAAPSTGRVRFNVATAPQFQYAAVFTGPSLDRLQPVPVVGLVNRINSFLAVEGTVYHFQISGGANYFTITLTLDPFLPATNDNFDDALLVKGNGINLGPASILGATMELGEPLHMDNVSQKSLWWKWQAPVHGVLYVSTSGSLITNIVVAGYQGVAVDALRLVAKGTNSTSMPVTGGEIYYLAAAVPAAAVGDVLISAQISAAGGSRLVPGNVLREPSWEGTAIFGAQYWQVSGQIGGYVNEAGGCDGSTWPALTTGARIWQDFATVPGHAYRARFAHKIGGNLTGCCGLAGVRVSWDERELGVDEIPEAETGFWHWGDYTIIASNTTSRITFENIHRNLEMDAFSVIDLSAAPVIINQPASLSTIEGGTAAFTIGVDGSAPLTYQWFHDGSALVGQTDRLLSLTAVAVAQQGGYYVTITNNFGAVTSAVASLFVDAPTNATILVQPYGDTVPVGGYFNVSVVAAGTSPLDYQWFLNHAVVLGATNRNLTLTNAQPTNAGIYEVLIHNYAGSVWSLPATLVITNAVNGGGLVNFQNRSLGGALTNTAPIFDFGGVTPLSGDAYLAQLYAGSTLEGIRPVGQPSPFRTGFSAGFFASQIITLPNVPPGGTAFAQVRVWERERGSSYEEARALGGKFGRSEVFQVTAGGGMLPPPALLGLTSFSLQAGLPQFTVGSIQFLERQGDLLIWSVQGQPGFHYLVEKSSQASEQIWRPLTVLTNVTGTVTFTDSVDAGSGAVFYRARILD